MELAYQIELPTHTIEEICAAHERLADIMIKKLSKKDRSIVFDLPIEYLKIGYYPYFLRDLRKDEQCARMT